MERKILNNKGMVLLKLKSELKLLSSEIASMVVNDKDYKKELLNNKLSIEMFEEILKDDKRMILTSNELKVLDFNKNIQLIEKSTSKKFTSNIICDFGYIDVFVGMTRGDYVDYMGADLSALIKNNDEINFAREVAEKRVSRVLSKIEANVINSVKIAKTKSKDIKIVVINKNFNTSKRYLCNGTISLRFPLEYVSTYKPLNNIIVSFLEEVWTNIEKYQTW